MSKFPNLKEFLAKINKDQTETDIGVTLASASLPLDLALEMVFRQQSQLFSMLTNITSKIELVEAAYIAINSNVDHLHSDVVELQGHLEALTKHPVERADEVTEHKEHPKKKLLN